LGSVKRAEWVAIAVTILLRIAAVAIAARSGVPWIDPDGYLVRAAAFTSSSSPTWLVALSDAEGLLVPPLYVLALSWLLRAGASPPVILIAQALLSGVACAAVIALARSIAGHRGGAIAGGLFAVAPAAVLAAPAFWSEALFLPLACTGLWLFVTATREPSWPRFAIVGLLFAAAALTRTVALYVVPALCVVVALTDPGVRRGVLVLAAVFAIGVGAYVASASRQAGGLLLVDNSAEWHWRAREDPHTARDASLVTGGNALARAVMRSPVSAAREAAARVRAVFTARDWHDATSAQYPVAVIRVSQAANIVWLVVTLALAIWGLAIAQWTLPTRVLVTWVAAQLVLIALSATNAGPRYRAPLEPAVVVLAAAACRRV